MQRDLTAVQFPQPAFGEKNDSGAAADYRQLVAGWRHSKHDRRAATPAAKQVLGFIDRWAASVWLLT